MQVAVTGGTGFLGRYIVRYLIQEGNTCRCWYRPSSDRGGFEAMEDKIEWIPGDLNDEKSMHKLVRGCDAVVHAGLYRPGRGFRDAEGDLPTFVETNVLGTIRLIESARAADNHRFIFISTCAVHEVILEDRKLDEAHPLWPTSHYGAHKAAIEKFIHSYGLGSGFVICSLRPTGIYGCTRPVIHSKWYDLVQKVKRGENVDSAKGGKEVHASDVAKAVGVLLQAEGIAGEAYNCYDRYISEQEVAEITKQITNSKSEIQQINKIPKHQIETNKIRALGMEFGGRALLKKTIENMLDS